MFVFKVAVVDSGGQKIVIDVVFKFYNFLVGRETSNQKRFPQKCDEIHYYNISYGSI